MAAPPTDVRIRPFADVLREQAKGRTHDELSEALHQLVARVQDTGRKGALTLVITVEPLPKGDGRALVISDEIKLKLPEHDRESSMFFTDRDGNLTRRDPNQLTFESLREVPPPAGVNTVTGEVDDTYPTTREA